MNPTLTDHLKDIYNFGSSLVRGLDDAAKEILDWLEQVKADAKLKKDLTLLPKTPTAVRRTRKKMCVSSIIGDEGLEIEPPECIPTRSTRGRAKASTKKVVSTTIRRVSKGKSIASRRHSSIKEAVFSKAENNLPVVIDIAFPTADNRDKESSETPRISAVCEHAVLHTSNLSVTNNSDQLQAVNIITESSSVKQKTTKKHSEKVLCESFVRNSGKTHEPMETSSSEIVFNPCVEPNRSESEIKSVTRGRTFSAVKSSPHKNVHFTPIVSPTIASNSNHLNVTSVVNNEISQTTKIASEKVLHEDVKVNNDETHEPMETSFSEPLLPCVESNTSGSAMKLVTGGTFSAVKSSLHKNVLFTHIVSPNISLKSNHTHLSLVANNKISKTIQKCEKVLLEAVDGNTDETHEPMETTSSESVLTPCVEPNRSGSATRSLTKGRIHSAGKSVDPNRSGSKTRSITKGRSRSAGKSLPKNVGSTHNIVSPNTTFNLNDKNTSPVTKNEMSFKVQDHLSSNIGEGDVCGENVLLGTQEEVVSAVNCTSHVDTVSEEYFDDDGDEAIQQQKKLVASAESSIQDSKAQAAKPVVVHKNVSKSKYCKSPVIFSPYANDPVRIRVAAYEKLNPLEEEIAPERCKTPGPLVRMTRTKTKAIADAKALQKMKNNVENDCNEPVRKQKVVLPIYKGYYQGKADKFSKENSFSSHGVINGTLSTSKDNARLLPSSCKALTELSNHNPVLHRTFTPKPGQILTHVETFITKPSSNKPPLEIIEVKKQEERKKREEREQEAKMKRELMIKQKTEAQKRKREEKMQKVQQAHLANQKEKQEQQRRLEKEKLQKLMQLKEKEIKLKEEALEKKLKAQSKAILNEKRRKMEEAARLAKLKEQEEEQQRILAARKKEQEDAERQRLAEKENACYREKAEQIAKMQEKAVKLDQEMAKANGEDNQVAFNTTYDVSTTHNVCGEASSTEPKDAYYSNNSVISIPDSADEDEETWKEPIPAWAQKAHRKAAVETSYFLPIKSVKSFMDHHNKIPDLKIFFPNIDRKQLIRTSSAVWNTPPRYSRLATN